MFELTKDDFIDEIDDVITVGEFYEQGGRRPDHLHLSATRGHRDDRGLRRRRLPVHPRRAAPPRRSTTSSSRSTVVLRVRAWPLELVNGEPLAADLVAEEVRELREQVAPDLFAGFDPTRFPATSLPAMTSPPRRTVGARRSANASAWPCGTRSSRRVATSRRPTSSPTSPARTVSGDPDAADRSAVAGRLAGRAPIGGCRARHTSSSTTRASSARRSRSRGSTIVCVSRAIRRVSRRSWRTRSRRPESRSSLRSGREQQGRVWPNELHPVRPSRTCRVRRARPHLRPQHARLCRQPRRGGRCARRSERGAPRAAPSRLARGPNVRVGGRARSEWPRSRRRRSAAADSAARRRSRSSSSATAGTSICKSRCATTSPSAQRMLDAAEANDRHVARDGELPLLRAVAEAQGNGRLG